MLYLDAPIGPLKGMMIYADHADPNLFYYVPERPRLAHNDGVPEFVFLKYRRDITDNPDFDPEMKQALGGGFMAFTVDLGVDDEQLDEIKQALASFAEGEVKLTPIGFRKGSVRLSITKDAADAPDAPPDEPKGLTLFEEVYGATKPSLFGFNRATFAVVLSGEAATLFEAALRSGISPIGVIYDLEFLGLRPAFNVKITAEYKRIYDHLEAQFGARGQIGPVSLGVDIGVAFQKLRDNGSVKVEVLNFTDDEDLRKRADAAFDWFKTELLKDFFKSSLEPPSFMRPTASGGLLGQLTSLLGSLGNVQTGPSQPQMGAPTTQAPTPADPPTNRGSVAPSTSEINRAAAGSSNTAAGGSGGGGAGSGANPSPFQVAFSLKYYHQDELKTREFEYSMQAAVARDAAPQGLFSTLVDGLDLDRAIKEVSLDDDFFTRLVATVSLGTDLESAGISKVAVNLEYPAERPPGEPPLHPGGKTFSSSDLEPFTFTAWPDRRRTMDYRYQMDIHFSPAAPWIGPDAHVFSDWITTRSRQLVLSPLDEIELFDLEVTLSKLDSVQISEAHVELRYEDAANQFHTQKTLVLKAGDAGQHWKLRLSHPENRTYQYRVVYFLPGNQRIETDWTTKELTLDRQSLVITEPFRNTLNIRLVPVIDPLALLEATVDITYTEEETGYTRRFQEVFAPDTPEGMRRRTVTIPTLRETPASYTYEVTVIRSDGSTFQSEPITSSDPAIVISDGAGTTHRIKTKLIGTDMGVAGLTALKVDLIGPGDDPDREAAIFVPSQPGEKTVTLVQPDVDGLFTYAYSVTGYNARGEPVPGDSGQTSDVNLLVRVPSA